MTEVLGQAEAWVAEHLRPRAGEFDRREEIPREVLERLAQQGYLGATFPSEYGGMGMDAVTYGRLTEIIGRGCCSARALLTVHTSLVGEAILKYGSADQRRNRLPGMARGEKLGAFALSEVDTGTDAKGVRTSYRREGSNFIITGQKTWISYGHIADFFLVIARCDDKITAFLVDRERGVETRQLKGLLASRGAHVAEINLRGVAVPEECVLGAEGAGFSYVTSTALDHGRYSIAWGSLAIAEEALANMVKYARIRRQFGKRICEFQLIQQMIANGVTKTRAARSLCLRAGRLRTARDPDAVMETTIAKYFASTIANEVAADAVQVHGGNGCSSEYPVERLFREAKIMEIIEGTSQIQQVLIAGFGLERY